MSDGYSGSTSDEGLNRSRPGSSLDDLLASRTPDVDWDVTDDTVGVGGPGGGGEHGLPGDGGREADAASAELGDLVELDVDAIVANEYQPRQYFDDASLDSLTASVKELGVLQPVLVRPDGDGLYELIAGERRWRAARRAGLPTIPAVVRQVEDRDALERAIVENLHRADLSAVEEARAYQQLIDDFGLTQDEVATRVGKSRSAVANTLRLLQLPAAVQRLVIDGALSAGHARAVLAVSGTERQLVVVTAILEDGLSVRGAEELSKRLASGPSPGRGRRPSGGEGPKSVGALEVERLLEDRLETSVEVQGGLTNGRLVIRFADEEDLARLAQLLLGGTADRDEDE
jgi:ParB family chromosome partitioning protein